ncbi:hypothetical protein ScPMuIL_017278 [Solemya velum]
MANVQSSYELSERLIQAISHWHTFAGTEDDDVEELIRAGADVNKLHGTLLPLHCACMVSDGDSLQLLLQNGARVNKIDGYGRAALHYAAERDLFCVEVLIENGAELNLGDGNMDTPLHWASFKNNVACVKYLLQHGADVDAKDYNLETPLFWAARKGHLEVLKILLEYNANASHVNGNGDTPLTRAMAVQLSGLNTELDDACLELLIKATSQFDLRDRRGNLRNDFVNDNKLSEMLLPLCRNPRKLYDLCRYKVRCCLSYRYLPNVIPKLPIPNRLQDRLLLRS